MGKPKKMCGLLAFNVLASLMMLVFAGLIIAPDLDASITVNAAQSVPGTFNLYSIGCTSASTCYATAFSPILGVPGMLVTITNGIPGAPQTIDGFGFGRISCPTTSICQAIGDDTVGVAVVTITNGIPDAPKSGTTQFGSYGITGFACSTVNSCYAVGYGVTLNPGDPQPKPQDYRALIIPVTNGIPGTAQILPELLQLYRIACPNSSTCYAVGPGGMVTITNGVVGPVQQTDLFLLAIACPGNTCYAVGATLSTLSEGFVVPIRNGAFGTPLDSQGVQTGIACVSGSGLCLGASYNNPVVVTQITNGIAGVPIPQPTPWPWDVACPDATTCLIVGGSGGGYVQTVSLDTTSPTLSLPGNIVINATGPNGASVSYNVSASDPDDTLAPPNCAPASGAVFPIGTTTVNCSVVDSAGNTANGSFTVTVNGPQQQLSDLLTLVTGLAPGSSLAAKIQVALNAVQQGGNLQACSSLQAFINEVKAQSGKMLTTAQATNLIMAANRIESLLGC
jgi:hypothetical protein